MNRENLQTLATFLAYAAVEGVRFDMWRIASAGSYAHTCGTVGCVMGWAGFVFPKTDKEDWFDFSSRVLGISWDTIDEYGPWDWCFVAGWSKIDNTRLGAAKRIQYLLDHNGELPDHWSYDEDSVKLYTDTVVKRGDALADGDRHGDRLPHLIVSELLQRIAREPRFTHPEREKTLASENINPNLSEAK